jgi:hypothetical protein
MSLEAASAVEKVAAAAGEGTLLTAMGKAAALTFILRVFAATQAASKAT